MNKRTILITGLILGLLLFWLLNTPKALSAGVCTCSGDVSVNLEGKGMAAIYGADLAGLCNSNGGKFEGGFWSNTCTGAKRQVPASSKDECEGYNVATIMEKFSIPSVVTTLGSVSFKCIWEESPELSPGKNATGTTAGGGANVGTGGPAASAGCPKDAICLDNPIEGTSDMLGVFGTIVKAALGIIGSLTLLMLVWGGFQWVTSAGNPEKVKLGTQTMIWAAIGAFLALASYLIMTTFLDYLAG